MAVTAYLLLIIHNLFAVVMMSSIYSLLAAVLYVVMDAVDVAFTEAVVGAGISTVLMLGTLALTSRRDKERKKLDPIPILIVFVTGILLVYGTLDMPPFSDPTAPIHHHVGRYYINNSAEQVGPPNIVTSVLASYRGYDTLGEVTVIFTAAVGVMALIGRSRNRKKNKSRRS